MGEEGKGIKERSRCVCVGGGRLRRKRREEGRGSERGVDLRKIWECDWEPERERKSRGKK